MKKMTEKAIDTMKKMSMAGARLSSVNSKKSTVQSTLISHFKKAKS